MIDHALRLQRPRGAGEVRRARPRRSARSGQAPRLPRVAAELKADDRHPAEPVGGRRRAARRLPRLVEIAVADGCHPNNPRPVHGERLRAICSQPRSERDRGPAQIGISACFFHADPSAADLQGQDPAVRRAVDAHWVHVERALPVMIPVPTSDRRAGERHRSPTTRTELDGLVLQGGSDVAPRQLRRGAAAAGVEGDHVRDRYEIELLARVRRAQASRCSASAAARSCSTSPSAARSTRTSTTQRPGALRHRDVGRLRPATPTCVEFEPGTRLAQALSQARSAASVNSVHHQAVKDLGPRLVVEARSEPDGIVEAVRCDRGPRTCSRVQWHPEFHPAAATGTARRHGRCSTPSLPRHAPTRPRMTACARSKQLACMKIVESRRTGDGDHARRRRRGHRRRRSPRSTSARARAQPAWAATPLGERLAAIGRFRAAGRGEQGRAGAHADQRDRQAHRAGARTS